MYNALSDQEKKQLMERASSVPFPRKKASQPLRPLGSGASEYSKFRRDVWPLFDFLPRQLRGNACLRLWNMEQRDKINALKEKENENEGQVDSVTAK